jgi:Domain of unknown function (DUF397)
MTSTNIFGTTRALENAAWRRSSRSGSGSGGGGNCVEVAYTDHVIGIRDSKNPTGSILIVTSSDWARFLTTMLIYQ